VNSWREVLTTTTQGLTYVREGFGSLVKCAFYDVRVFNPLATRYRDLEHYALNEKKKKKAYNERIIRVEHGSCTPIRQLAE